jgi:prepilin-type N-terminal cleavage/methylation domain-containing protein
MKTPPVRSHDAFTLIELLIVILVLAIAAAIVIPSIGSASESQAIAAARVLQSDLEVTRSLAVTTQQPYSLVFSPDRQSYKVVVNYSGAPYASVVPVGHPVNRGQSFEVTFSGLNGMQSVVVTSANFGGQAYATFQPLGDPVSPGSVVLRSGNSEMTVAVEGLTGIITAVRTGG